MIREKTVTEYISLIKYSMGLLFPLLFSFCSLALIIEYNDWRFFIGGLALIIFWSHASYIDTGEFDILVRDLLLFFTVFGIFTFITVSSSLLFKVTFLLAATLITISIVRLVLAWYKDTRK